MDWTRLYDDDGGEVDEQLLETRASRDTHSSKGYGSIIAYCMTLNYVLGVGALAIPNAFTKAGVLLGVGVMLVATVISTWTVNWLVEVCARAQVYNKPDEEAYLLVSQVKREKTVDQKYEVTQLCDVFMGPWGKYAYQVSLCFLMYTGLWAYCSVFINSCMGVYVPEFIPSEYHSTFYALVFGAFAVTLSCMDLTEQKYVQAFLSFARFFTMFAMIISPVVAMTNDPWSNHLIPTGHTGPFENSTISYNITDYGAPPYIPEPVLADWSNFGMIFTTGVFSLLFQHSVPGLIHPVANKKKVHAIFGTALFSTSLLYILLGVVCSLYFGAIANSSINLNWDNFRYGVAPNKPLPSWAYLLNISVLIFPALDTFSVYPLISITLGNSIDYLVLSSSHGRCEVNQKATRLFCRLLASVPPIFACMLYKDIALIVQLSGFFGLYVAFFTPCLLMLFSERACSKMGDFGQGPKFRTHFSHRGYVLFTFLFAFFTLVLCIIDVVHKYQHHA